MRTYSRMLPAILGIVIFCFAQEPKHCQSILPPDADFIRATIEGLSVDSVGSFGSALPGMLTRFPARGLEIAITLDACGGGYNSDLIACLKRESIPATLFVSGSWITNHPNTLVEISRDTLFEIENHGLNHRVPTVTGRTVYGIKPTQNPSEVVEEIEGGARMIENLAGQKPRFFRPATGFMDEASFRIAQKLGMTVVDWDVASGDAVPFASAESIADQILSHVRPGSIVILHLNHPLWHEREALERVIPILKKKGYRFIKLKDRL